MGTYSGYNSTELRDRNGNQTGRLVEVSRSKTNIQDRHGNVVGSYTVEGNRTVERDRNGNVVGSSSNR